MNNVLIPVQELITKLQNRIKELEKLNLSFANNEQKLAEYEKNKNWIRGYNYKGELVKEFALYIPKLILK